MNENRKVTRINNLIMSMVIFVQIFQLNNVKSMSQIDIDLIIHNYA